MLQFRFYKGEATLRSGFCCLGPCVCSAVLLRRSDTLTVGKKVEKLPPPPGEIGAQRLLAGA